MKPQNTQKTLKSEFHSFKKLQFCVFCVFSVFSGLVLVSSRSYALRPRWTVRGLPRRSHRAGAARSDRLC